MKKLLLISIWFYLVSSYSVSFAQCTVSAWPDTSVCAWEPVHLHTDGILSFNWTPASSLINPVDSSPIAYTGTTTTYQITTYCTTGELIVNGNFESGNTGFTSMYAYDDVGYLDVSSYYIASRGDELGNIPWDSCFDHTFNNPSGHMMLMNGSEVPNTSLWCQTVSVVPNTDYQFSAWATPVYYSNPPILQFSINGANLGSPFHVSWNSCLWQQFFQIWNSGLNTTADICIVNQNTVGSGNDFAIDDISFSAVQQVTASVTVNIISTLSLTVSNDTIICEGGTANLSVSGADSYTWAPATGLSATTGPLVTATPAITTTYTVTGITGGCSGQAQVVVHINDMEATVTSSPSTCGLNNGSATATANGGSGTYTYLWSTALPQTTPTATNLAPGSYQVTVSDGVCSVTDNVTVSGTTGMTIVFNDTTEANCGLANGAITAVVSGGTPPYDYVWNTTPAQTTATATGLSSGTYSVTVNDAGSCSVSALFSMSGTPAVNVSIAASANAFCSLPNGTATALASGGTPLYTYTWNTSPVQNNPAATNLPPGSYTVTVTDAASCTSSASVTIQNISVTIDAGPDTLICLGNTVQLFATGALSYIWSPAATLNIPNISNPLATPTVSTTYQVSSYCTGNELIVNGDFESGNTGFSSMYLYDDVSPLNQSCYYVSPNGNALNNGWSNCEDHSFGNGTGHMLLLNGAPDPNTTLWCQSVNVTPNTNYQFSAWATSVYNSNPPVLQFSINGTMLATPFSVALPPCSWQQFYQIWNSGIHTTADICIVNQNTIASGNDFAIDDISFSAVIPQTATVAVTVIPGIPVSASNDTTICIGTSATLTATGATDYIWSPPTGLSATTGTQVTASPAVTTTYTVTGSDNGCTGQAQVIVTVNNLNLIASATPTLCGLNNGSATAVPGGGTGAYTYQWSTNPVQHTAYISNLPADNYTVTVSDGICTLSATVTVNNSSGPVPTLTNSTPADCGLAIGSATVSTTGGTPPYNYIWNTIPVQTTPTALNLHEGNYIVSVSDVLGCSAGLNINISGSPAVVASIIAHGDATCGDNNGWATVTGGYGTPPYTYAWGTTPPQSTPTATGLSDGTYLVTVTDAVGCSNVTGIIINNEGEISLFAVAENDFCNKGVGNAGVLATGGTGSYTYHWSNGQSNNIISGLTAGWYYVTVSDSLCSAYTGVQVVNVAGPTADFSYHPQILAVNDGPVTFTDNSTGNITQWQWDFGDGSSPCATSTAYHEFVTGGNFLVTLMVTDINNCSDTAQATVVVNDFFSLFIPDAFTPNGDGLNDFFEVYGTSIATFDINIFNRWGDLIFHSDDFNTAWNGTRNNKGNVKDVVQDVYVYKIYIEDIFGKEHVRYGRIVLYK